MSEQDTTTPEVATADTPDTGAGIQQDHDWQQRYESLQPEYTRATQEAAQLRQWQEQIRTDPDAQRQLLAELGYDVADDTPDTFQTDQTPAEIAELRQELEQIRQAQTQHDEARQIAAAEAHFSQAFNRLGEDRGFPLSDAEQEAIVGIALTMPAGQDGMPPVSEAFSRLEAIREADAQRWATTKRTTHRVSPNGGAGHETPDLDDAQQRQAWMAARYDDLNADS